jgi:hypothetical protein
MSQFKKIILGVIVVVMVVAILDSIPRVHLFVSASVPGRIIRWCLGEPGSTQWVNDTVDQVTYLQETAELQDIGDRLISEFSPISSTLSEETYSVYSGGKSIPLDKLPIKYRQLGGMFGDHPDLVLQVNKDGVPIAVIISWGHMRRSITIFSKPPSPPPQGFFVRKLNDRVYVVAGES